MILDPKDILMIMEEHSPFNRLLGIRGESAEPGRVVMTLPVRPDHVGDPRRPALHGGVVASLVDTAGGAAAWSALVPGESVSTVDLTVDYLEPAGLHGPLRAEATLLRKGNRVCHVRVAVTQGTVLVAEGRGVYNIHRVRSEKEKPAGS
ncbi:MAG: PaaI family thioesterase [Vicinamibacteria bacterium]